MKSYLFRIGVAFLTLAVGVGLASWRLSQNYPSLPQESVVSVPSLTPINSMSGSLPCAVGKEPDVVSVKRLLDSGVSVDSTADSCISMEPSPRKVTLLMQAAGQKNIEVVKLLLERGANVNASNSWHSTPLSYAIGAENIEVVNLLIEKGADVNAHGELKRTPLMAAANGDNLEVMDALLKHGADINAADENGTTALMVTAGRNHLEAMNFLLNQGANPQLKDKAGRKASVYIKKGFPKEYIIVVM